MKIVTIVGARPQFVKAAAVSRVLRKSHTEILVHTGQHFDQNMSKDFFEKLEIPEPDYYLGIKGGTHAQMTASMLVAIEKILVKETPDIVLVYGDTNSTLAGALAAAKMRMCVCHVEAGVRTGSQMNPEEINRRCTDQISSILLTCTKQNYENLFQEGLSANARFVGDLMYDSFLFYKDRLQERTYFLQHLMTGSQVEIPDSFYYLTCHREENTLNKEALKQIFDSMEQMECSTIYPVHPRNKERAKDLLERYQYKKILLSEPVDYFTSLYLLLHAKKVITDSGGLQREAFFAGRQCVTVLDFNMWPETTVEGRNRICPAKAEEIIASLRKEQYIDQSYMPFGDGNAAVKIVEAMENWGKIG